MSENASSASTESTASSPEEDSEEASAALYKPDDALPTPDDASSVPVAPLESPSFPGEATTFSAPDDDPDRPWVRRFIHNRIDASPEEKRANTLSWNQEHKEDLKEGKKWYLAAAKIRYLADMTPNTP